MEKNVVLTSPLAGGARRTGKSEGYIKENNLIVSPSLVCADYIRQTTSPALGGSQTTNGFTLIELLVVVLIIGILAAVAVPQYTKAVEKSRGAQAITVLNSIAQAVQSFYMASGTYPTSFDELDIDMDSWTGRDRWYEGTIIATRSNGEWSLQLHRASSGTLTLYIGRLTGKYKGMAFGKNIILGNGELADGTMFCAERKTDGVVFTESDGSYCKGVWKATWDGNNSSSFRAYKMP